ncbi:PAB-dependent poly(A)-specific ribonuclease subunit PAN2 [Smittium culicis]|uniref:PAB-dependent poly(A)-specific ribonuclease subunit PAN2 n=1 Tax=Smittium culicis TaxID=133412 RepID=A0A1R1XLP3_9FUNG|nr:PAB-dependent poly(A)-specific ribonuclease subunit PAN2 [Smittium culicis]
MAINHINQNEIVVSNSNRSAKIVNMDRGTVQKNFDIEKEVVVMSFDKNLTLGTSTGLVVIRDPRANYKSVFWNEAYSGGISDLRVIGNNLITSGYSLNQGTLDNVDWDLRLFDIRKLELPVCQYDTGIPAYLCSSNGNDTRVSCCYIDGFLEELDISAGLISKSPLFQTNIPEGFVPTASSILENYKSAIVGDSGGVLHLWKPIESKTHDAFIEKEPLATVQNKVENLHPVSIDDEFVRFSFIHPKLDFLESQLNDFTNPSKNIAWAEKNALLSDNLGLNCVYDVGKPACLVTDEERAKMVMHGFIGTVPNFSNKKQNQVIKSKDWRDSLEKLESNKTMDIFISSNKNPFYDRNKNLSHGKLYKSSSQNVTFFSFKTSMLNRNFKLFN